jgi:hypothetical protein
LQLNCVDTFVVSDNKGTIHQDIQNVVRLISKRTFDERRRVCLLYKDSSARLYNVVLIGAEGLSAKWEQVKTMYSGMQAACAIVLLARLAGYFVSSIASKLKYISLEGCRIILRMEKEDTSINCVFICNCALTFTLR